MLEKALVAEIEIAIRFNEVDALGIVWHGNYIKYFEDGREAFGEKFNLNFQELEFYNHLFPILIRSIYHYFLTFNHRLTFKKIKMLDEDFSPNLID